MGYVPISRDQADDTKFLERHHRQLRAVVWLMRLLYTIPALVVLYLVLSQ